MSVTVLKDTRGAGVTALAARFKSQWTSVLVGVPKWAKEADGTPIATIAAVHEFGSSDGRIPERSFLRTGIRAAMPQVQQLNKISLRAIGNGTLSVPVALGQLGALAVGAVQKQITSGSYVPLRPATIRRKGSSKPLIDSGSLRASISYQLANASQIGDLA